MTEDLPIPMPGQRYIVPMTPDDSNVKPLMPEELDMRALRLWPNSPAMREKWVSAVRTLRAGRGWVLDPGTPAPGWHAQPPASRV